MSALARPAFGLLLSVLWLCAFAQATSVGVTAPAAKLTAFNRDIIELRATVNGATPEERVLRARERIFALPPEVDPASVGAETMQIGELQGRAVFVRNSVIFLIFPQDLDPTAVGRIDDVAQTAVANLRAVLEARDRQLRPRLLLEGAGLSLAATAIMLGALWLIRYARRGILRGIERVHRHVTSRFVNPSVIGYLRTFESLLVRLLTLVAGLMVVYLWLAFVL